MRFHSQQDRTAAFAPVFYISMCLAIVALLLCGCARRSGTPSGSSSGASSASLGVSSGSLVVGDVTRTYTLYVPLSSTRAPTAPLVIVLHGGGGTGSGMQTLTHMNAVADANGFFVAYPDGIDHHWNDGRNIASRAADDVGFISALIDALVAQYHLDAKRVYVTGISNGAIMSQRLGCELANKIATIAPDAGPMAEPESAACHPARPMPVVEFHGDTDPIVPYGGGAPECSLTGADCGTVISFMQTLTGWAQRNGCSSTYSSENLPDTATNDGPAPSHDSTVTRLTYSGCPAGGEVVGYIIHGGGHTWPGGLQYLPAAVVGWTNRDIDASELIWSFFATHHL